MIPNYRLTIQDNTELRDVYISEEEAKQIVDEFDNSRDGKITHPKFAEIVGDANYSIRDTLEIVDGLSKFVKIAPFSIYELDEVELSVLYSKIEMSELSLDEIEKYQESCGVESQDELLKVIENRLVYLESIQLNYIDLATRE